MQKTMVSLENVQTSLVHMVEMQLKQLLNVGRRTLFIERTVSNDNEEDTAEVRAFHCKEDEEG